MSIASRCHTVSVATTLVLSLLLVACGETSKTPEQYLKDAETFAEQGQLDAAAIQLRNALKQNPNMLEARTKLGAIALEQGDGASAEKETRRALELGLAPQLGQLTLAKAILLQGDYKRLIEETDQLAPKLSAKQQSELLSYRGEAYLMTGDAENAKRALDTSLEMDPENVASMAGMAIYFATSYETDEARKWIQRALQTDEQFARAWSVLGTLEFGEGNFSEAESAFTRAIELQNYPTLDRAKRAMARIELEQFDKFEADIKVLEEQGLNEDPFVAYITGIGYFKQGKYQRADEAFQAAYAVVPNSVPLLIYLASTNHALGNAEQALSYAKTAQSIAPRVAATNRLLGVVQFSNNEVTAAKTNLEAALEASPDSLVSLRLLAAIANLEGDTAATARYLERVVDLEPESEDARLALNIARLLDGQTLDPNLLEEREGIPKPENAFDHELLEAIEAFSNGKFQLALNSAEALQENWPEQRRQTNSLISACYLALGDWDKGQAVLEEILADNPKDGYAARNLAILETNAGKLERARDLLKSAIEQLPKDESTVLMLADLETRLDNADEAILIQEEFLVWNPHASKVVGNLAETYFAAQNYPGVINATASFSEEQLLTELRLLELRGKSQLLTGDKSGAIRSFKLLVGAVPESAKARFAYADSLLQAGDRQRGREELRKAIEIDPTYIPPRVASIQLLMADDEQDQAEEELAALKKLAGSSPQVLALSGQLNLRAGNYADAEKDLASALEQAPNTDLFGYYCSALWHQEQYGQAIESMKSWLEQHPEDLNIAQRLASAYVETGQLLEARARYENIIKAYPEYVPGLNDLAYLLGKEGKVEQALDYAERAYQLAPSQPLIQDTLGVLLIDNGEVTRGASLLAKAAQALPDNLEIQLHLAQARVKQENYPEARDILEGILAYGHDSDSASAARSLLDELP